MPDRPSKSTRREFLKGRSAVDAAGQLGQAATEGESSPGAAQGDTTRTYLVEVGRRAMACQFEVFLNSEASAAATECAIQALDLIEQLEDQLSIYRHRSEVSQLNVVAGHRAVKVEPRLWSLLDHAVRLHGETAGAFDITSGPLTRAWSGLRREGRMPTDEELNAALDLVGSDKIQFDHATKSIRFARPGVTIDLGGIGKGYALDRSAERLGELGVSDYMMHGGSSSILARGHRRVGASDSGWTVGVRHPLRADRRLLELQLVDRAVGTSGAGTQQFYHGGKRYGHIIDPRSGRHAEGVLSSTVIAPQAAEADALSTAFYILGVEQALDYCARHSEIAALLTTRGKQAGTVELHAVNCDGVVWRRVDEDASSANT